MGYMPSHPLSARKTRQAVRDLALDYDDAKDVLLQHERSLNALIALAKRPLWGRLKWLATGK